MVDRRSKKEIIDDTAEVLLESSKRIIDFLKEWRSDSICYVLKEIEKIEGVKPYLERLKRVLEFDKSKKHTKEVVKEDIGGSVISSELFEATEEDIEDCLSLFLKGDCPHTLVEDESFYLYDVRKCSVCGKGLGTV